MTRMCRACPNPHPLFLQAEPDWYRPSVGEQIQQAAGCLAHVAALLIGSLVIWGLLVVLFLGAAS